MTEALRPSTLGEILDRTFQIYRQSFASLLGVAAIPALLMLGIQLVDLQWLSVHSLLKPFRQPAIVGWNMIVALGFYHIASLVGGAILPALVKQGSCAVLDQKCTLRASLGFFLARWRSYFWLALLKIASVLVLSEVVAAGLFVGMGFGLDALGMLNGDNNWAFAFLLIVPTTIGVYLFLRVGAGLSLALPAAALEDLRGTKALRRSWRLTRDSRGRLALTFVLIMVFGTALSWGLQMLVRWGLTYLYWHAHFRQSAHFYQSVFYLLNGAVGALIGPLYPLAVTLIYYDQRIRHEGFDIEWMMNRAGMNAPVAAEPAVEPVVVAESGEQPA